MKVAWIYPFRDRCGISIYARRYAEILSKNIDLHILNLDRLVEQTDKKCISSLKHCDLVHLQYESSYFFCKGRDRYQAICNLSKQPPIVSLHEIYNEFPGVYPRQLIEKSSYLKWIRLIIYDWKHPYQSAFRRHVKNHFYASKILVHHEYQAHLLKKMNIPQQKIFVLRNPIYNSSYFKDANSKNDGTLQLGSTGFISSSFDFDLLFKSLEKLSMPWTFTWIGGPRASEGEKVLIELLARIRKLGWNERFIISGWVDDETQNRLIDKLDIYCAFFKHRSSSASIASAIGRRKLIIANRLPLTEELEKDHALLTVDSDPEAIVQTISQLTDPEGSKALVSKVDDYAHNYSFANQSKSLAKIYESLYNQRCL